MNIQCVTARNGQPTLRVTWANGRSNYLHSSYDPAGEAMQWAARIQIQPENIVVLFGLGLGYHLAALASRYDDGPRIFVVEPNEQVEALARSDGPASTLLAGSRVQVVRDWKDFHSQVAEELIEFDRISLQKIPVYGQLYEDVYRNFAESLKRELTRVLVDFTTLISSSEKWQLNFLKNLRYLPGCACASSIFGRWEGKPLILVSAGPSLEKNIDVLAQAQGKAAIAAVGTVARVLLERGITPDLILTFDGNTTNYFHHFRNFTRMDIPLVFDPMTHYKILEGYPGPRAMMLISPANRWLEEETGSQIGHVEMGPSIANTGLALATLMKADPIILVGQDLAFTERRTHMAGTHDEKYKYQVPESLYRDEAVVEGPQSNLAIRDLEWVQGIDGGQVATDKKMLTFLSWFENFIASRVSGRVIDATEGGARIAGTEVMTLADTISRYCPQPLPAELETLHQLLTTPAPFRMERLQRFLKSSLTRLRKVQRLCQRGAALIAKHEHSPRPDLASELNRIDRYLKNSVTALAPLHYLVHPILGFLTRRIESTQGGLEDTRQLYRQIAKTISLCDPLLYETILSLAGSPPVKSSEHPWIARDRRMEEALEVGL